MYLSLSAFNILSTSISRWNAEASRDNSCSSSASVGADEDDVACGRAGGDDGFELAGVDMLAQ